MVDALVVVLGLACIFVPFPTGKTTANGHKMIPKWPSCPARTTSLWQACRTMLLICLFMVVGPGLMVLNKDIMQRLDFSYPLTLSSLGVIASASFARLAVAFGFASVRSESLEVVAGWKWCTVALPVGACKAAALACGNAVYLFLGLGFIQMLKAFTPAVVLIVMVLVGAPSVSKPALLFILLIVAGTVLEVQGELNMTIGGLALMMAAEFCEAFSLVLTQRLLQDLKFSIIEGFYVLGPVSAFCLVLAAAVLEWPRLLTNGGLLIVANSPLYFIAAATMGLVVNFVSFSLIQVTSTLFCKILNAIRGIMLVIYGVIVYGEECTTLKLVGYSIALFGFAGYNYVQMFPKEVVEWERRLSLLFSSSQR